MARGAKTITVQNDEDGSEVEVTLWVDRDGGLDVGISDENLNDTFPLPVAAEIADAIKKLQDWATSLEGTKRILEMQEKEEEDYKRTVLRRPVKKKGAKKS